MRILATFFSIFFSLAISFAEPNFIVNGKIVTEEASIHASNVMFFSKDKNITSKIEVFIDKDGVKKRRLKKTGELID